MLTFTITWNLPVSGKRRYNIKLWKTFTDCFNCLPVAAIIDEKIFCCHGGLSPDLQSMEQIRRIMRPTDVPDQGFPLPFSVLSPTLSFFYTISLFLVSSVVRSLTQVINNFLPLAGLLCDLLWSDPDKT